MVQKASATFDFSFSKKDIAEELSITYICFTAYILGMMLVNVLIRA